MRYMRAWLPVPAARRSRCDAGGADTLEAYTFQYAVTFTNDTAAIARIKPLLRSVLTVESFNASNGYTCGVEYNPSTCGATAVEPAGAWAEESTCAARETRLAFSWVVPPGVDIDLHSAVGHQHIGATGVQLLVTPPGGGSMVEELVCESVPRYVRDGPSRGFIDGMSSCNFGAAPRRLASGTKLRGASALVATCELALLTVLGAATDAPCTCPSVFLRARQWCPSTTRTRRRSRRLHFSCLGRRADLQHTLGCCILPADS
jgi:hypothetical protein